MKKTAINLLGQIVPIMIGVYLGFAMNNFGENQKLNNQSNTYKKILRNEITENLEAIESVNSYHVQLSNDISKILEDKNIIEKFGRMNFNGYRPGLVSNSAFDTGIQTGIIKISI